MMDKPLWILEDELAQHGLSFDQRTEFLAGLSSPEDMLDFAEWLVDHREANRQEMLAEKHRLMRNRQRRLD